MKKALFFCLALCFLASLSGVAGAALYWDTQTTPSPPFDYDLNSPFYYEWTHGALGAGMSISSASVSLRAFDVSLPNEIDKVYAYDGAIKTYLGNLDGASGNWSLTTFPLGPVFYDDIQSGLQIAFENTGVWYVYLDFSYLQIEATTLTPLPGTLLLLGGGLAGLALMGRRFKKV